METGFSWKEGNNSSNNHLLNPKYAQEHLWGYNSHKFIKTESQKGQNLMQTTRKRGFILPGGDVTVWRIYQRGII